MRGARRQYDYPAMKAAWEEGRGLKDIMVSFSITKSVLYEIVARNGWQRPTVEADLAAVRSDYESGVVLSTISKQRHIGAQRIMRLAKEGRWTRPNRPRDAAHLQLQSMYEAGVSIEEMSARSGYLPRTIQTLRTTYGWFRKDRKEKPRTDPLGDALARAGYQRHVATPTRWSSSANLPAWGAK